MSNERGASFWISAWWPVALGAALIAVSSSATFGTDHTSGPLRWCWQAIFGPVNTTRWNLIHFLIRKTGHFVGYGTLGLAWLRAWRMSPPRVHFLLYGVLAVLGTALVAACDEFHQTFLPNRTGSPWDVLLDSCGAMTMCLIALGFVHAGRRLRTPRSSQPLRVPGANIPS
jgi:VanZ family protein